MITFIKTLNCAHLLSWLCCLCCNKTRNLIIVLFVSICLNVAAPSYVSANFRRLPFLLDETHLVFVGAAAPRLVAEWAVVSSILNVISSRVSTAETAPAQTTGLIHPASVSLLNSLGPFSHWTLFSGILFAPFMFYISEINQLNINICQSCDACTRIYLLCILSWIENLCVFYRSEINNFKWIDLD